MKKGITRKQVRASWRAELKKAAAPRKVEKRGCPKGTLAGGLTLITPTGFRLEGISSTDLVRVLSALK